MGLGGGRVAAEAGGTSGSRVVGRDGKSRREHSQAPGLGQRDRYWLFWSPYLELDSRPSLLSPACPEDTCVLIPRDFHVSEAHAQAL